MRIVPLMVGSQTNEPKILGACCGDTVKQRRKPLLMHALPPLPPPINNEQLEALVAAASPADLRRALRIVLGAEQAYWERDLRSGQMWYSPPFFGILGLPPTHDRDLINARIHPDDRLQFEQAYSAALQGGGTFHYDVRYSDVNNQYRWARAFGRVWLDEHDHRPLRLIGTMIDVHAERQARLDADAHARRYKRALDAASEAHFERTAGLDDFVVSDNFALLLGHPPGTPPPDQHMFLSWVHPDDLPKLTAEIAQAWVTPGTWAVNYRLRLADGGWRWFRGRGRTEPDGHGRLRMSGMVGDVHQQELDRQELDEHRHRLRSMVAARTEELNAALAEARRQRGEAERASNAKSEFLAHMSHELRTPLNGLLGLTELALNAAEQPAQRRYLDVALTSGRALLQLINEVLDLSRLDAGGIELACQSFDLPALLADVMRSLMTGPGPGGAGGSRAVSMRFDWVGEVTQVLGDPARVRQVVTNLVANAIKFTERGHVALTAELVADASAPGNGWRAIVRIEDSGPGIEPALRERVFDAFVQGDASLTRQHGGSGLGLAISRRLARAMGGEVTLERSSSEGSRFAFTWPLQLDLQASPLPRVAPGRLWLVYRDAAGAQWIARRLERIGWRCDVVPSVDAAAARARQEAPAQLPTVVAIAERTMDAGTDLAALRAALPQAHIALLVRPDWNQPALERAALAQGAVPTVLPLTPQALNAMLSATHHVPRAAAVACAAAVQAARVLVVEDNAVNLMITEEFVRQLGHVPTGVADGAAAIVACEQQAPQLVLMDLQMPVMDGLETTRRLRVLQAEGRLPRFPIVALTAHASDADRKLGASAGMDDYLTKPILIDALRAAFERWIKGPPP
jgi:signal transduction histidine kinase/CheY-like chemotaxis protein